MELSVNVETRNLRVGPQHRWIFDQFWKHHLFPLVKIIRFVEDDSVIVDICTLSAEKDGNGGYGLIARQVEIIKNPEQEASRLTIPHMN